MSLSLLYVSSILTAGVNGPISWSLWRLLPIRLWQMGPKPPGEGHGRLEHLVQRAVSFLAETAQRSEFTTDDTIKILKILIQRSFLWLTLFSWTSPVHMFTIYFCKIHFDITLPIFFPKYFIVFFLIHACYVTYPSHYPWFLHMNCNYVTSTNYELWHYVFFNPTLQDTFLDLWKTPRFTFQTSSRRT